MAPGKPRKTSAGKRTAAGAKAPAPATKKKEAVKATARAADKGSTRSRKPTAKAAASAANVPTKVASKDGAASTKTTTKVAATRKPPASRTNAPTSSKRKAADADAVGLVTKKQKGLPASEAIDAELADDIVIDVGTEGSESGSDEEFVDESDAVAEEDEDFGAVGANDDVEEEAGQAAATKPHKRGKTAAESQFEVAIPRWTSEAKKAPKEARAPAQKPPTKAPTASSRGPPRPRRLHLESDDDEPAAAVHSLPEDEGANNSDSHVTPLDGPALAPKDKTPSAASPPASVHKSSAAYKDTGDAQAASRAVSVVSGPSDAQPEAAARAANRDTSAALSSDVQVVPPKGGAKLKIREQPETVTKVIQHANKHEMPEFICFKNAFPSQIERPPLLRQALVDAAKAVGYTEIEERLRADRAYADSMARIPEGRISNLRGKIKLAADQCVMNAYELPAIPAPRFVRHIHTLRDPKDVPMLYTYPSIGAAMSERFNTQRPYCHPAIITVLHNSFFGTKAAARFKVDKYMAAGRGDNPELPIAMVALAATAVYVALEAYALGPEATHVEFEANKYTKIYCDHVETLEEILLEDEGKFSALMAHLFKAASGMKTGSSARRVDTSKIASTFD
ncbi:hypothetical protein FA95DRAFT_1613386 [Auriscalpium vulgare]|uniref:Uncharacterized protein n=1 Tax=Auriscalpium vulgare TaxID=40419 RepID=A0ACB8R4H5_9AGAM|nr:hypothetical protein FA95DRAFT_1613386 [Auriscalpium vulgare]